MHLLHRNIGSGLCPVLASSISKKQQTFVLFLDALVKEMAKPSNEE